MDFNNENDLIFHILEYVQAGTSQQQQQTSVEYKSGEFVA